MEHLTIDKQEYMAISVKVEDHITSPSKKNQILVTVAYTSIAVYKLIRLYKNCSIFPVTFEGKTYPACFITAIDGNITGSNKTTPVSFIISY